MALKMKTILIAFDLWEVIEVGIKSHQSPKVATRSGDEESEAEQTILHASMTSREDKIKNAKALSLIQGALTDNLFPQIRNEKTAKGAWDILSKEFRGDKKLRVVKLQAVKADFEYLRMEDSESLDGYLAKFLATVNNLKSLGEDVSENRIMQKLLMILSRRYKSIVSIIEETRDLDVLRAEEVIASVKVYDKREDLHDERDKLTGIEKAFSSLKIGNNQAYSSHKGFQGRPPQRWQSQDCEGTKFISKQKLNQLQEFKLEQYCLGK
uniref:UBN2 domain-containing protein n=1 Tax=Populus alba TaxID=43335 RepID=A0A4U5NA83_POPAL|nr:uncharacterized protein LOC118027972 [Populus alba]TKR79524.1 hypothetical protein D5086_0000271580 [Populus alba]